MSDVSSQADSDSPSRIRRLADERGATMVLFGLLLVFLLSVVAIVVDLGNARQQKRQLQSAVDSAALAGANALGGTDYCTAEAGSQPGDSPVTAAASFTFNNVRQTTPSAASSANCATGGTWTYNGSTFGLNVNVTVPYTLTGYESVSNKVIRVEACESVPTTFAKVIGFGTVKVCAHASALKTGSNGGTCTTNCGTQSNDPDRPCGIDDFLLYGYFDSNSPPNGLADPTADDKHSGGAPGGAVGEGKIVGATFYSTATDIDLTTLKPYFVLENVTAGTSLPPFTYVADNNPAGFHIHAMTSVIETINGVKVTVTAPPGHMYQVQWKIPSGNPNNANYTVHMGVNDNNPIAGASCGRTTWSFVKGTPPGSSTCGENSFLNSTYPTSGATIQPNGHVGAIYQDESPINTNVNPNGPGFGVIMTIDGLDVTTSSRFTETTVSGGSEKYGTRIDYQLPPATDPLFLNGTHTVFLKAWDGDQNASGGDCGIGTWKFTLSGVNVSASVKLVD